jgi:drug/metabolite transporter (DMT)-like permease
MAPWPIAAAAAVGHDALFAGEAAMSTMLMSRLSAPVSRWLFSPQARWTLVGATAIPLWALWPLFAASTSGTMPLFQFLAVMHAVAALTLFVLRRSPRSGTLYAMRYSTAARALVGPAMVTLGILGSNICFVMAIRFMPPAPANLIVYLWPLEIVLLAAAIGLVSLGPRHLIAVALGFAGAAVIVGPTEIAGSWLGIGLALASGLVWAVYCVYRLRQGEAAPDALTAGLALSGLVALIVHFSIETTTLPSAAALLGAILSGSVSTALPNLAWDVGIRRGNRLLLAVFAYATPMVSALFLIAFGYAQPSLALLAGGALIVAGSLVSVGR